jgi:hypothetical protein
VVIEKAGGGGRVSGVLHSDKESHGNAFHPQRILKISSAVYSNKDKLACVSVATASNDDVQDADFNASITGLIQAFNIYSQIIV